MAAKPISIEIVESEDYDGREAPQPFAIVGDELRAYIEAIVTEAIAELD